MKTLYDYLNLIRKRRALFGIYTARDIFNFISGYSVATVINKIDDPTVNNFNEFAHWLRNKNPNLSNFGAPDIIEIYSTPISSFEEFFYNFEKFLEENPIE